MENYIEATIVIDNPYYERNARNIHITFKNKEEKNKFTKRLYDTAHFIEIYDPTEDETLIINKRYIIEIQIKH